MKNSCKSLDVFEFKEEDELIKVSGKRISAKFENPYVVDHEYALINRVAQETKIQSNETGRVTCGLDGTAPIDYNPDAIGSFTPLETENLANEKACKLKNVVQNSFNIDKRAAEVEYIIETASVLCGEECISSPGSTACLEDESVRWNSGTAEGMGVAQSMSWRSPYSIAYNDASDGSISEDCFTGWDLGDDGMRIAFYPDYIEYCGMQYLDSVASFSRNSVEVKSKTIYGNKGTFDVHLEIEDIVKIESQWSARFGTGSISIYFISKDAAQDEIVCNASVSGIQEVKLAAVDSNWYEKKEAIELLDVRYKALWSVLLDTGMEKCLGSPEGEAIMQPSAYLPTFDKPFGEVIYPKGDPDAVSISKRDIDLLQPDTFVNDTIIDFYIKYLRTRQNVEERIKCHFFNSFFFRKLADMDKDPSSAFDGKAAFQRVRKWTRKVNLLDKEFIFIPVNYNYHWSLIVICYFGEVASYRDVEDDKFVRVPCILHMDSIRGSHVGLKDLMQSYLWEEWKERQKETCEDLYSKFRNLKFVSLELPQQQNSYDCGLFLLHYVELFLEGVPANFSIYKITSSTKFLQADWFPPGEASMKRAHIERLIHGLLETHREDSSPSAGSDTQGSPSGPETAHDCENGVDFSEKDGNLMGFFGSSERPKFDQGIEMTLLPASSLTHTQCARSSGLVLKELFMPGSATASFNVAIEGRVPHYEFKQPLPLTQEEELSQAVTSFDDDEKCKPENPECSTICFTSGEMLKGAEISNQNDDDDDDDEKHSAKRMKIENRDGDGMPALENFSSLWM